MTKKFTSEQYKKSIKTSSQKPILKYFRWERYFTRPVASLIVRAVFRTSVTPNQITYVSFIFGLGAAASFFGGSYLYFILGGALFQFHSIIDCADGQLARAKNLQSRYGAYLDIFLDRIIDIFILVGIVVGYYRYSQKHFYFILGLIAFLFYNLAVILYYILRQYQEFKKMGDQAEGRGFAVFVILFLSLLNRLEVFIILCAVLSVIYFFDLLYVFLWKERVKANP
jgi:phosphatidylglycerophosphate synthase